MATNAHEQTRKWLAEVFPDPRITPKKKINLPPLATELVVIYLFYFVLSFYTWTYDKIFGVLGSVTGTMWFFLLFMTFLLTRPKYNFDSEDKWFRRALCVFPIIVPLAIFGLLTYGGGQLLIIDGKVTKGILLPLPWHKEVDVLRFVQSHERFDTTAKSKDGVTLQVEIPSFSYKVAINEKNAEKMAIRLSNPNKYIRQTSMNRYQTLIADKLKQLTLAELVGACKSQGNEDYLNMKIPMDRIDFKYGYAFLSYDYKELNHIWVRVLLPNGAD